MTRGNYRPIFPTLSAIVGAGAAGALLSGPLIRTAMLNSEVLDRPNERSSHDTPTPRGGGWAVIVGTAAGCAAAHIAGMPTPWKTLAGAGALALVGFADDRWSVPALPRLAAQLGTGMASDVATHSFPLGSGLVPGLVNVVNFMDGINGITAMTTAVWGLNAAATGLRSHNDHVMLLGAASAGAALGFLPHNVRRERMFLGDVGSYMIGATIALTTLHSSLSWTSRTVVLAPMAPYLLDTGTTLVRRLARGDNVFEAHREHTYQELANERGLGHLPVAGLYAGLAAVCALVAQAVIREA